MDGLLPRSVMDTIRRTAKSLKGHARRVFQAIVTNEHAEGRHEKQRRCSVGTAMQLNEGFSSNIWVGKFALSPLPKGDPG